MRIHLQWAFLSLASDVVFAYPDEHVCPQWRKLGECSLAVIEACFEGALVELLDFLRAGVDVLVPIGTIRTPSFANTPAIRAASCLL